MLLVPGPACLETAFLTGHYPAGYLNGLYAHRGHAVLGKRLSLWTRHKG